jgi:hypothetical protein
MISGRLFTFGCSFTRYHYPTWADILGQHWNYYENWGKGGAGNQLIFNSIIECDQRHSFNEFDTVLILWSSLSRYDYYQFGEWLSAMDAFPDAHGKMQYNCPDGQEMFTYAAICAIHQYLSSKQVKFKSMRWQVWDNDSPTVDLYSKTFNEIAQINFSCNTTQYSFPINDLHNKEKGQQRLYSKLAGESWPSLEEILSGEYTVNDPFIQLELDDFLVHLQNEHNRFNKENNKTVIDGHPLPSHHLDAVSQIWPEFDISKNTRNWINQIEMKLLAGEPYIFNPSIPKERL